jgi:serine/threonine-protein kinase
VDSEAIGGRYRREERLGAGGMAEVWSAYDSELGRRVAIKLLGPGADRERFEREARAAAALSHPNICLLFDYGETEGRPYMVLEYLPGGTLEDRLAGGRPLPDDETARIAREVAAGLEHAHERGLVHRDLKPANILFDAAGTAKIADFGIARLADARTLTEAGTVLGTAAYLAPEQAKGEPATAASDVYAFGVILYRMLSGRLPFESDNALEVARMHRDVPPVPVATLRDVAPPVLASLAMAALAKSPADRPADGGALVRALEQDEATVVLPGRADARTEILPPAPPRPRRRRALALAGVLGLLAAGIAVAFALSGESSAPVASLTSRPTATATQTTVPVASPSPSAEPTETPQPTTETGGTDTEPTVEPTVGPTVEPTPTAEPTVTGTTTVVEPTPTPFPTEIPPTDVTTVGTDTTIPTATTFTFTNTGP